MESLEFVEVSAHGMNELVLLGAAAANAWFINNLEPSSGEDLLVKDLPLDRRPGACRSWDDDEEVIADLQVPARR